MLDFRMRVAAVQLDIVWEDKPANHAAAESLIEGAGIEPGALVVLPELADTGFSFDIDRIADEQSAAWAASFAARCQLWLQAGFARRGEDGRGRNCAAIVSPAGELGPVYEKVHPFQGREAAVYGGGDHLVIRDCDGAAVCPLICYDLRFPELWRVAVRAGAEVFTIGASWPAVRQAHWRALLIARAIENQAYVVGVNRVGRDPNVEYAGGSIVVSPTGEVVAEAGTGTEVLTATLDLETLRRWRASFPALRDTRTDLLGSMDVAFSHPPARPRVR